MVLLGLDPPINLVYSRFSGGWKIHKEEFFKNVKHKLSKLRGGYGELGNSEPAGDFAYNGTTSINSSNVIFGPDGTVIKSLVQR